MRILLIEDDRMIGDGLKAGLGKLGFAIDWFEEGRQGAEALASAPYDAVILDLGLPGLDGMEILAHWRSRNLDIPVLILTARDALEQRVAGLNAGADDYLCKPFALTEVAARLHALIRRRQGHVTPVLTHGPLVFDPAARSATLDGKPVFLAARELALLELFLQHKGRVLSRETIIEKLYDWDNELESNAIDVHIHHLRKKLGAHLIRTLRGIGYTLGDTGSDSTDISSAHPERFS